MTELHFSAFYTHGKPECRRSSLPPTYDNAAIFGLNEVTPNPSEVIYHRASQRHINTSRRQDVVFPMPHQHLLTNLRTKRSSIKMSDRTDNNLENGPIDPEKSLNSPSLSSDPAESKPQPPPEAPEGGSQAFLSLLGGSLGLFISFGWVNCIAVFQAEYETNQLKSYSSSEISWITSSECEICDGVYLCSETDSITQSFSCFLHLLFRDISLTTMDHDCPFSSAVFCTSLA